MKQPRLINGFENCLVASENKSVVEVEWVDNLNFRDGLNNFVGLILVEVLCSKSISINENEIIKLNSL